MLKKLSLILFVILSLSSKAFAEIRTSGDCSPSAGTLINNIFMCVPEKEIKKIKQMLEKLIASDNNKAKEINNELLRISKEKDQLTQLRLLLNNLITGNINIQKGIDEIKAKVNSTNEILENIRYSSPFHNYSDSFNLDPKTKLDSTLDVSHLIFSSNEKSIQAVAKEVKCENLVYSQALTLKYEKLLKLVAGTESIDCKEKQYWYDMMPSMTKEQIQRLDEILTTEEEQLNRLYSSEDDYCWEGWGADVLSPDLNDNDKMIKAINLFQDSCYQKLSSQNLPKNKIFFKSGNKILDNVIQLSGCVNITFNSRIATRYESILMLIMKSLSLNCVEKLEWINWLPKINKIQMTRLEEILLNEQKSLGANHIQIDMETPNKVKAVIDDEVQVLQSYSDSFLLLKENNQPLYLTAKLLTLNPYKNLERSKVLFRNLLQNQPNNWEYIKDFMFIADKHDWREELYNISKQTIHNTQIPELQVTGESNMANRLLVYYFYVKSAKELQNRNIEEEAKIGYNLSKMVMEQKPSRQNIENILFFAGNLFSLGGFDKKIATSYLDAIQEAAVRMYQNKALTNDQFAGLMLSLSWNYLPIGDSDGVIKSVALGKEASQKYALSLETNLAHAYILANKRKDAIAIYKSHINEKESVFDYKLWQDIIQDDFTQLRKIGLSQFDEKLYKTIFQ